MTDINKNSPIKRHPALVKFSQDHHFALLLVWKIKQGIKSKIDIDRIVNYLCFFSDEYLKTHFVEEEKYLFFKLNKDDSYRIKAENEHICFLNLISNLENNKNKEYLLNIVEFLDKHIRFEERILFNYLQDKLTENDLSKLLHLNLEKHKDPDINWEDKFWLK